MSKRLEVDRIPLGRDAEGNMTADDTTWVKNTPRWHNIILKEYDDDEMNIIVDIDVPWRYNLVADMIEAALTTGVRFGVLRAM